MCVWDGHLVPGWFIATDFWSHFGPAVSAVLLGSSMLNPKYDGGPPTVRYVLGPSCIAAILFYAAYHEHPSYGWIHKVHWSIFLLFAGLCCSIIVGTFFNRRHAQHDGARARRGSTEDDALPLTSSARPSAGAHPPFRYVHDPAVMAVGGLLLWHHRHDVAGHGHDSEDMVRTMHHQILAGLFLATAATMTASCAVHLSYPPDAPVVRTLARGHAFCWLLIGWFSVIMSFSFYLFTLPSVGVSTAGLYGMGLMPHAGAGHEWEESLSYLAGGVYVAALHTGLVLQLQGGSSGAAGRCSSCRPSRHHTRLARCDPMPDPLPIAGTPSAAVVVRD